MSDGRVVDVGCGTGGLTAELAARVGADNVAGIDPAGQFVAACREKVPGADVREGVAESLPWGDDEFDAALSSLVIAFMKDPDQGVREMARVVRPGGTVAVCMWDIATGGMAMLNTFWAAAREVDPTVEGERMLAGTWEGDIAERFGRAGLGDVEDGTISARAEYESSRPSGSRLHTGWARRASTSPRSRQNNRTPCARPLARSSRAGPSRWMPAPGTHAGSCPRPEWPTTSVWRTASASWWEAARATPSARCSAASPSCSTATCAAG